MHIIAQRWACGGWWRRQVGWAEFQKMIPTEVEDHHRGTMTVAAPGGKHAKARPPGAPMRTGTCGEVAAQKRRGTSAAWLGSRPPN